MPSRQPAVGQRPATDSQQERRKLAEPVWPEPAHIAAFADLLLELGLPAKNANLIARAVVFPEEATIRPNLDQHGATAFYEIEADFFSCLTLPVERWQSLVLRVGSDFAVTSGTMAYVGRCPAGSAPWR